MAIGPDARRTAFRIHFLFVALAVVCSGCAMRGRPDTTQDAAPIVEVGSFALLGVESIDEEQLRRVLQTKTGSWIPFAKDRPFDREAFDADLKRIVAYYRDRGYPDARVVTSDVRIDEVEREAHITVRVSEGEPRLLSDVSLDGFTILSAEQTERLVRRMPMKVGEPIVFQEVAAGGELAADALRNRGYAYAEVRVNLEEVDARSARVRYVAEPGPPAFFGDIEIVGNRSVNDDIIRRELVYRPGQPFRRDRLQESQRQLYALELFQFATIDVVDPEQQQSEVRTRVTLAEAKHRRVEFSVGYGTEEKARGELTWRNLNFMGGARSLGVRTAWSSLTRGAQVDLVQPYIFHPRLKLTVDGHFWNNSEPAYTLSASGGRVSIVGDLDRVTTTSLSFSSEDQRSRVTDAALQDLSLRDELIALGIDPVSGRQGGLLTSLAVGAERDTARNPLDPRQGYALSMHLERAGGFLPGAFDFMEWRIGGRHYQPITRRAVLATRLRLATIDPSGTSAALPFTRRYFLGGSTSLRGWGRYEVSPLSSTGLVIGGRSVLESSAELRVRLKGNFGVALFADAGNVWPVEWQWDLGDLRADTGAGLRYTTPVGPVRADFAWQLTPIEGLMVNGTPRTRRWRIHFSIGQAF
jgi:outer membrane protein assembly complex protein YaeT